MRRAVLEATRTSLRWVVVEHPSAKPKVQTFRVLALSQSLTEAVVRQAIGARGAASSDLVSAIPREQLITRVLKLPSVDAEELAGMVALNGKAQLPYPPDQTLCDFQVIEQRDGVSTVHLVACHRDVVDGHLTALQHAGLTPSLLTPSSWGVAAWYQRWGASPGAPEPVLVVNVDADHTDLVLIRQGRVVLSRSLSQGNREWEATDGLSALGHELGLTLAGLRKELPGIEAASYLLTGVGPLDTWSRALASQLGRPVVPVAPATTLRLPQAVGAHPGSVVVALGLAAGDLRGYPNLLPPEARQAHLHRRRMRLWKVTGILWISSLVMAAVIVTALVRRQEQANARLLAHVHELEDLTHQTEAQAQRVRLMEQILAARREIATSLAELFHVTPPDIMFESVTFERHRQEVVIRGSAPSTRDVLAYLHQLEALGLWPQVELRYSAHRSGPEGERTDFEIVLTGRRQGAV